MKRYVAFILVLIILLSNICYAIPVQKKNETVYVNLDSYGNVSQINIYSKWLTNGASELKDYTKYIEVNNLTNRTKEIKSGDEITWNVSGDKNFTYTGMVGEEYYDLLPWKFNISYKLNGVEVLQEDLLGAQGLVKITMDITSNEQTNSYYRNNYILEITGSYDMSKYISVNSEEAMITDTGNTKTLMFIVLPGQSKTFNIEIGSDDFTMDGITMALVPITGDIRDQIVDIVDDKNKIKDAIDSLDSSTNIVLDAMSGMTSGLNGVSSGISEIKQGTNNLYELNTLRNEDVSKAKEILNELLPAFESMKNDIDNMEKSYNIITEYGEELNKELKNLNDNIDEMNDNLEAVNKLMKYLPSDVETVNDLLKTTADVVSKTKSLVKKMSSSNSDSSESVADDLTSIAKETQTIGTLVQQTVPNVTDEETGAALLKIGNSASNIGKNLKSVQGTLEDMSNSTISGTSSFQKSLDNLQDGLNNVSQICSKQDAKKFVGLVNSINDTSHSIETTLNTIIKYNDKLIENKNDVTLAIGTMRQLTDEFTKIDLTLNTTLDNLQKALDIVDSNFYNGTNKTIDSISSVNKQMAKITSQSGQIKNAKNSIKNVVDDRIDEMESKTTLWNMEKDAKVVSFGSEKNENVESVQFILKTPDIKKIKKLDEDLEKEKEQLSFLEKVSLVFQKIWSWILNLFNK